MLVLGILLSALVLECGTRAVSPLLGPPLVSWNPMEDAKRLKFEEFLKRYQSPEYVFMGNSTTLIGVNPGIFDGSAGFPIGSSFNAGMNGADIKTMRDFALGFILKKAKPKNLVLLFSNAKMIQDGRYQKLKMDSPDLFSHSYFYQYRKTLKDPMTLNTVLRVLKYRDTRQGIVYRWADNLDDFGYSRYKMTDTKFPGAGWDPGKEIKNENKSYLIDDSQLKYLTEIRDFTRHKGVNLIIGTVPLLAQDPEYRGIVRDIANRLGIGFIQGNDVFGQGQYFQDVIHVNKQGSRIFSEYLAQILPRIVLKPLDS